MWIPSWPWYSGPALTSSIDKFEGSWEIQSTCALCTWRRLTTMSPRLPCGQCCGSMGYWGHCCKPFGPYLTAVRAVSAFLTVIQTHWWVSRSTREELEGSARIKDVWVFLLNLMSLRPSPRYAVENGRIDGWRDLFQGLQRPQRHMQIYHFKYI